jgi:hypothetical protein
MVLNHTFNNISIISCRSVLLVEDTEGHGENQSLTKCDHLMFYRVPLIKSINAKKDSKYNDQKGRKHKRWP